MPSRHFSSWGLANVHEETWGPFGRGWSNELFEANEIAPRAFSADRLSQSVDARNERPVTADAIYAKIEKEEDFALYRGKLRGLFVLTAPMRVVDAQFEAHGASLYRSGTGRTLRSHAQPASSGQGRA